MMRIIFGSALVLLLAASAQAQSPAPDSENGRFAFNQVAEGFLRLDTRTGQVSLCAKRDVGWACQTVPDERTALEGEIGRLQNENAGLKKEMLARGMPLPGATADSPAGKPPSDLKLPSDQDIDRVMTFMEKIWRRLLEMVQNAQRDLDKKG